MSTELVQIAGPGLELGPTSLTVLDPNLTIDDIEASLANVLKMGDTVRWWAGDLLLYAESRWGEDSAQILDALRISQHQSAKYRWVAEKVAPSLRRENLSFSHHELVAALPPSDQARLLKIADTSGHAVAAFREIVRDHKAFENQETLTRARTVVLTPPSVAVDAARGLRTARETLRRIATDAPEAAETLEIPRVARGLDAAAKVVQRAELLEEVLAATSAVLAAGVLQSGLPDPAVFVPSGPWETLVAAHARATEGRTT